MGSEIPADVAAPDVRLARRRQVEAAVDELRRALREEAPTYMKHVAVRRMAPGEKKKRARPCHPSDHPLWPSLLLRRGPKGSHHKDLRSGCS